MILYEYPTILIEEELNMKYLIFAAIGVALASAPADAQSRRAGDRVNEEMIRDGDALYAQAQARIDNARSFCERNGGTFYMSEVRINDRSRTRSTAQVRDRGPVYQRGRTTVVDIPRLILGPPRPETTTRGDSDGGVDTSRACVYPRPPRDRR